MARPITNTVEFFPHFTNASDKRTLTIFEGQYETKGYAFWFKLLEYLGKSEGHYFDARKDVDLEFLVRKCGVDLVSGTEMLNKLAFLDAIDQTLWSQKIIWSQNFVNNLANVYNKRGRELPSKPSFCNGNNGHHDEQDGINGTEITANGQQPALPTLETPQSKESKESKESKVKRVYKKNVFGEFKNVSLTTEEYEKLITKFGKDDADKKIEALSFGVESKGYKYASHYATILSWDRNDNKLNKPFGGNNGRKSQPANPEVASPFAAYDKKN